MGRHAGNGRRGVVRGPADRGQRPEPRPLPLSDGHVERGTLDVCGETHLPGLRRVRRSLKVKSFVS